MAEILDLLPRFIELFAGTPTVDAIIEIAGPGGKRFDFTSGQTKYTTDDAEFNVSIDEDPAYGVDQVSISAMREPPTIGEVVERYGPGARTVYSSPGRYGYRWPEVRRIPGKHRVTLSAGMLDDDRLVSLYVSR